MLPSLTSHSAKYNADLAEATATLCQAPSRNAPPFHNIKQKHHRGNRLYIHSTSYLPGTHLQKEQECKATAMPKNKGKVSASTRHPVFDLMLMLHRVVKIDVVERTRMTTRNESLRSRRMDKVRDDPTPMVPAFGRPKSPAFHHPNPLFSNADMPINQNTPKSSRCSEMVV